MTTSLVSPARAMWLLESPALDGDVLLALSDGVTDNLTFSEMRRLLGGVTGPAAIAQRLVEAAATRSHQASHPRAKADDITAVAARVGLSRVRH